MGEEKRFNFVYERRTQEDNEFIKSLQIISEYHHDDITRFSRNWSADRKKGMYLIYNDAPNALVNEGVTGGECMNFIYKNKVNSIEYERKFDFNNKIQHIRFLRVDIHECLLDEKDYVLEAIKEAIKVRYENNKYNNKCVLENDIEEIYYK